MSLTLNIYAHGQEAIYFSEINNKKFISVKKQTVIPHCYDNNIMEVTPNYKVYKLKNSLRKGIKVFSCAGSCGLVNIMSCCFLITMNNIIETNPFENLSLIIKPLFVEFLETGNLNSHNFYKTYDEICKVYCPILDKKYRFYNKNSKTIDKKFYIKIKNIETTNKKLYKFLSGIQNKNIFEYDVFTKFKNYFIKTKNSKGYQLYKQIENQSFIDKSLICCINEVYLSQIILLFKIMDIQNINIIDYSCRTSHHDVDDGYAQYDKMLEIIKESDIPNEEQVFM
jgi:hypothetical protein